jgi:hypothetical protein
MFSVTNTLSFREWAPEIDARYEVMCELFGQRGSLNCYVKKLSFMLEKRASPRLNVGHVDPAVSHRSNRKEPIYIAFGCRFWIFFHTTSCAFFWKLRTYPCGSDSLSRRTGGPRHRDPCKAHAYSKKKVS